MRKQCSWGWVVPCLALSLAGGSLYAEEGGPPPIPAEEQPEVLTRGPVHEAFAEPVSLDFQAGVVATTQPPPDIVETPPADRPVGDHYVWVPGYWSWDGERHKHIWVSACWRVPPPTMAWVPGYWAAANGHWEWVPGFWTPAGAQEMEYLSPPPAYGEVGPPGPPPSANHVWVPPCQYWVRDEYVPRNGYWLEQHAGWAWEPSHYIRTPRGYVFCAGHWDHPLEDRGMLFAPVAFPDSVYGRAELTYSPSIVIDLGGFSLSLFTYPRYNHYYFGDYYDDAYVNIGIYPRFDEQRVHTWYDSTYQYDRWDHRRTDPRWEEQQRRQYAVVRADVSLRPARTYAQLEIQIARAPEPRRESLRMAQPLATVVHNTTIINNTTIVNNTNAGNRTTSMKFEKINTGARQDIAKQATEEHKFREQRVQWESKGADPKRAQLPTANKQAAAPPDRVSIPAPHIAAKSSGPAAKAPPARPAVEHAAPAAEHKAPAVDHTPPAAEHKAPAVDHTPPAAQHPAPVVDHTAPAAEHKAPVVDHTPPAAEHKAPVVEHTAPAAEHKAPVVDHTPPAVEHKAPVVDHTPPAVEHKAPVVDHTAPAVEHKAPVVEHPAPAVEHKAPVIEHTAPAVGHKAPATEGDAPAEDKDTRKDERKNKGN